MRFITTPLFLLCAVAASPFASATIVTLGTSNQNFGLTGIGPNAQGQGQSKITWGACSFDGTNTQCILTGSYTGINNGGTYTFTMTYPGNGPFPVIAVTQPGSNLFSGQVNSNYTLLITLAQTGGPTVSFYSQYFTFNFVYGTPTCTGVTSCSVSQVGQTPNATIIGPITGSYDPSPMINTGGVISASAYGGFTSIAPATWIEIYGNNLGTILSRTWGTADFNGNQAPNTLAGTTVTVGGQQAFIDFVSPTQVNAQVPSNVATGPQPVVVTTFGGSSVAYTITVNTVEPGILAPAAFHLSSGQYAAAVFANTLTFVLPPGAISGVASQRATPGDILTFYGVGFGTVTPNSPAGQIVQGTDQTTNVFQAFFGGTAATVQYAGLVAGFLGLYQFNVVVPKIGASDTVPVTFTLGGTNSTQQLLVAVN